MKVTGEIAALQVWRRPEVYYGPPTEKEAAMVRMSTADNIEKSAPSAALSCHSLT